MIVEHKLKTRIICNTLWTERTPEEAWCRGGGGRGVGGEWCKSFPIPLPPTFSCHHLSSSSGTFQCLHLHPIKEPHRRVTSGNWVSRHNCFLAAPKRSVRIFGSSRKIYFCFSSTKDTFWISGNSFRMDNLLTPYVYPKWLLNLTITV